MVDGKPDSHRPRNVAAAAESESEARMVDNKNCRRAVAECVDSRIDFCLQ